MKHLFLMLAAFLTLGAAAQSQDVEALNKKLSKSDLAITDVKKNTKFATWADRSKLFVEFANVYSNKLIAGAAIDMVLPVLGQPDSMAQVQIGDLDLVVYHYPNIEIYLNLNNVIQYWKAKNEPIENPLGKAYQALAKAKEVAEVDFLLKGLNFAAILQNQYNVEGNNAYSLNNKIKAAKMFEGSLQVSELMGQIDTLTIYNTGMAYFYGGDYQSALPYFEKVLALGDQKSGDVYYYISTTQQNLGHKDLALETIEKGFELFPQSPTVMSGIINAYMNNNKDPERLVSIIHDAQKLDSTNVSLFITEGAIWDKIGRNDKAEEAFFKAAKLDPENSMVYFNIGLVRTKNRDQLTDQAQKLDLNDATGYDNLMAQSVVAAKGAIEMLEKAHKLNPNEVNTIALLRELYYTLRDEDPTNQDKYEHYMELHKNLTGE